MKRNEFSTDSEHSIDVRPLALDEQGRIVTRDAALMSEVVGAGGVDEAAVAIGINIACPGGGEGDINCFCR